MAKDERTFPEIWNSLTQAQQEELRDQILTKTGASSNTFWFWKKGAANPASRTDRQVISGLVGKYLNISTAPATLFPRKR
jgi:hypothetical protein